MTAKSGKKLQVSVNNWINSRLSGKEEENHEMKQISNAQREWVVYGVYGDSL